MSLVDQFRIEQLKYISNLTSFRNSWSNLKGKIAFIIGDSPTPETIYKLGENLEKIFRSHEVLGRDNSAVSTGGVAWECLVCWYLNLVFYGTDVVVIRPHVNFTPPIISDALTVSISNHATNTESDLIAFNIVKNNLDILDLNSINNLILQNPLDTDITVIQCKTNWNDNAQIPMLWDLIYSSERFRIPNVSVGRNGINPSSFRKFAYSFIAVPTSRGSFTPSSLAVLRVSNLTGGNFWGRPTQPGVSRSVSEFFTTNYATHFSGTIQQSISNNILRNRPVLEQFINLDFT